MLTRSTQGLDNRTPVDLKDKMRGLLRRFSKEQLLEMELTPEAIGMWTSKASTSKSSSVSSSVQSSSSSSSSSSSAQAPQPPQQDGDGDPDEPVLPKMHAWKNTRK